MDQNPFRLPLFLPAQGAAESEATIIEWCVSEGDCFQKGQVLGQIDSAKSVFDFEAPCDGRLIRLLHLDGETVAYDEPVMEIETADPRMRDWIPPATAVEARVRPKPVPTADSPLDDPRGSVILGLGGYLPRQVVTNPELIEAFPEISADYIYQVTGIQERRWAAENEKPSDMAYAAALEAIRKAGIATKEIDAIILATTTPDVAMPSTACILQDRLNLTTIPAFDLNAACSGWLYAVAMARMMTLSGMARNVLAVGVDVQSHLLDRADESTCFLFGDGAGAAIVAAGTEGHRIREVILGADTRGLHMARRQHPGYLLPNGELVDSHIRLDGHALFRFATESFATLIQDSIAKSGWTPEETRWIVPHQANARILKAAARRSRVPFDRFYLNIERVGNTSSASIPLALLEVEDRLQAGDKLVLCAVGAGITTAAISVEW
ncbi:MAG: beta-ketoacyl-ACP synthase 3 [Thermoguttaceae bacterium]|jgi:3-oxoacyl-[acyl-carrier-protein] synthase-3